MSLLLALVSTGVAYTLDCEAGSYTIAGSDATFAYVPASPSGVRSGVTRLWLIDYYTKAFAKPEPKPEDAAPAKRKPSRKAVAAKVEQAVARAELQLESLTRGLRTEQAAQQLTLALLRQIATAPVMPRVEIDFERVAQQYREKMRRDDEELLLLAAVI